MLRSEPHGRTQGGGVAQKARELLIELQASRLEVVLIPSRDPDCAMRGGMIRAVQEENAKWYQEFCGLYESARKDRIRWRKFKTRIKRRETIQGLKEVIAGKNGTIYSDRLYGFIERMIANEQHEKREQRAA